MTANVFARSGHRTTTVPRYCALLQAPQRNAENASADGLYQTVDFGDYRQLPDLGNRLGHITIMLAGVGRVRACVGDNVLQAL